MADDDTDGGMQPATQPATPGSGLVASIQSMTQSMQGVGTMRPPDESLPGPVLSTFAEGGKTELGTTALVGEKGPEIVKLPPGARVIPAKGETPTRAFQAGGVVPKNPILDAIFSNPLINLGTGAATQPSGASAASATTTGDALAAVPAMTLGATGPTDTSPELDTSSDNQTDDRSGQVYSPQKPDLLSTWNTSIGTVQRMMKLLYQPDKSQAGNKPAAAQPASPGSSGSVYGSGTPAVDPNSNDPYDTGMTDTEKYLEHGRNFYYDNTVGADNVVGNSGTIGLHSGTSSDGWTKGIGTEFGEVDNPKYGGYTEANWNKGAWGDDLTGWDTEGVALPNVPHGTRVEVMNPETGATTITTVKDKGPGAGTGAAIDLLGGTRAALGLPKDSSYHIQYRILGSSAENDDSVNNHKSFGADLTDNNQEGASLPESVIKNSIGNYDNDPSIREALRRGDYRLAVSNQNGDTRLTPLIAAGPSDWTGKALHLTNLSANDLATGGNGKVSYKLIGPDGSVVPIKGYHPHSYTQGDINDHIGANRKKAGGAPGEETPAGQPVEAKSQLALRQNQQTGKTDLLTRQEKEYKAFKTLNKNDQGLYASGKNNKELFKQQPTNDEQAVLDRIDRIISGQTNLV